ncbi:ABC transporter substrate-binding protein [Devosia sp. RR2S18]|uniref:ABC transporter substrate-binding protein n=1 Tax=Devosia rhizosphaerae TaxID=3049774 RepID=UPI002540309C|nr:extracellular solute-binding protein [Devosia sp. RR2S18]WIJ25830.1 extracellular solute-binding protein [Devosia sp. RR2S18]
MTKLTRLAAASVLSICATGVLAQDTVTLRVWDTFTETSEGMDALIAAFEEANPDIDIQRDVQSVDDMSPTIQTALNSGSGPDVFYYDTGPGFSGVLADAGLLRPLDELYDSGELDHLYEWTRERSTFGGQTYGIGNAVEFLSVYYNADIFEEHGLSEPSTYEEFLSACDTLKEAGIIPVAFGNAAGWPAFHIFSLYANNLVPQDQLQAMIRGEQSWDAPEVVEAIDAAFVEMQDRGCYSPSVNAASYDDANALFTSGMAAMTMTGSWIIPVFSEAPFNVDFFFLPAPEGGTTTPPAGLGSGYFVSATTENPEAAERFLTFIFDPENASYWVEDMSILPPYPVEAGEVDATPLLAKTMESLDPDAMGLNIDVLTPEAFNTTMLDGFQAVLGGDRTAEEQAAALQSSVGQ